MTVDDLQLLGPRQRQVMELRLAGLDQRQIAGRLGITANSVAQVEYSVRKRVGSGTRRRSTYAWRDACRRGHAKELGKKCAICAAAASERRHRKALEVATDDAEAPTVCQFGHQKRPGRASCLECAREADREGIDPDAAARVTRELAEGKRCGHQMMRGPCCLLRPCADHGR